MTDLLDRVRHHRQTTKTSQQQERDHLWQCLCDAILRHAIGRDEEGDTQMIAHVVAELDINDQHLGVIVSKAKAAVRAAALLPKLDERSRAYVAAREERDRIREECKKRLFDAERSLSIAEQDRQEAGMAHGELRNVLHAHPYFFDDNDPLKLRIDKVASKSPPAAKKTAAKAAAE